MSEDENFLTVKCLTVKISIKLGSGKKSTRLGQGGRKK